MHDINEKFSLKILEQLPDKDSVLRHTITKILKKNNSKCFQNNFWWFWKYLNSLSYLKEVLERIL